MNAPTPIRDTPPPTLRRRVFDLLDTQTRQQARGLGWSHEKGSFLVEVALVTVIAINSTALILWTVPRFRDAHDLWFHVIEHITVAVFLVEYV